MDNLSDTPRYFQWEDLYSPTTPNPGLIEDSGSSGSRSDYSGSPYQGYNHFATPSPVMEQVNIPHPEPLGPFFDTQAIDAKRPQLLAELSHNPIARQTLFNIVEQLLYSQGVRPHFQTFTPMLIRNGKNFYCPFAGCQHRKGFDRPDRAADHICTEHLGSHYQCPLPNW
jgi:hypothetical protein